MTNLEKYKEDIRKEIIETETELTCVVARMIDGDCDTTGMNCTACELNSLVTHYVKDEMYRLSRQCRITILCDIAEQKAFGYGDVIDERDWMSLKKRLELSLN